MVLDNKKIPQEKNKIDTNFPNKQETNIQSENQQSQLDYVGFRPEVIPTETIQNPEQQNTVNTEQIKDESHIEIEKNLDSRIQTLK